MRDVVMKSMIVYMILLAFAAGCGSAKQGTVPSAASGANEIAARYPSELYIVRSGRGETPEEARDKARFEIVTFFESRITGETILRQHAESTIRRGRLTEKILTDLSRSVTVSGEREIPGIEIIDGGKRGEGGLYEAWAVLSKRDYAAVLGDRIAAIDSQVDDTLGRTFNSDLEAVRGLSRAVRNIVKREEVRQDLTVLTGSGTLPSRGALLATIAASVDSIIANALDIGIITGSGISETTKPGIMAGLTEAGIRVKDYNEMSGAVRDGVDMIVSTDMKSSSRTMETTVSSQTVTLYWSEWVLSLTALDPATREVIDTVVLSDKASGRDPNQSRSRMETRILDTQVPTITGWIYKIIYQVEE